MYANADLFAFELPLLSALCCAAAAGYFSVISDFIVSLPADLSPGLAALTVGCDSGNLGSLSRVQLLLLDRAEPDTLQSASGLEEDWSDLNWSSAGIQLKLI